MLHRLTAAIVAVAFLAACSTHVQINSNPQGARVWVNDKDLGVTPATTVLEYNSFTQHRVRLEKPGFLPYMGVLRTEINVAPIVGAVLCICFLPALLWVVMPAPVQNFELVPAGASSSPAVAGDAPAPGDHHFTIVPGVPAVGAPRFFPAMEAAAKDRQLSVWRSEDTVQVQPEPRVWMRYRLAGDAVVLDVTIESPGADVAEVEARIRKLHEELMASATKHAEQARAFETAPAPTPMPTQEIFVPPATPEPTRKPKKYATDLDREPQMKKCASGLDCGPREFCKDRGDGLKLCMGNNVRGEFCASGIDCAPSLFCKDRGDGLKVCIGQGRRGDACSSGIDCEGGLFCKDPGNGFKECM